MKAIRGEDRSQTSGQAQVQLPHDPVDLAPSNLTAEKVDGGINLSWTAPAADTDSVTAYEVLRAAGEDELITLVADTGSTTTTYTDATATDAEETYAYQVKAIRGQAKSQGSNKVIEVPEPPATPENLAPSNLTFEILEDGVALTWDAPAADADGVTGYRVLRRLPNQGENEWLVWEWDTGSTETAYKDGYAQTLGEYYMYRVRALRGDEYSKMSNRVDVRRPEAAPETTAWAPSNLEALVYGKVTLGEEAVTTQVRLTWDAPADGTEWVRGYEVQRATCDGGFTTLVADTDSTATAYTDASVTPGESYTYRVRARRPQGLSLTSNTWTVLLPGGTGEGACGIAAGPGVEEDLRFAASMHDEEVVLVKNTGQTVSSAAYVLNNSFPERAQQFTTGANTDGYTLGSIGIMFHTISNTSTAGDQLAVTLNADNNGNPGDALCTLSDPATFTSSGVQTFGAPGPCPTLASSTAYFAVIGRVFVVATDTFSLSGTSSSNEDTGGAAGWTVRDGRHFFSSMTWQTSISLPHLIEVRGAAGVVTLPPPPVVELGQETVVVKNTGQTADGSAVGLTSTRSRLAQQFTTGPSAAGYRLGSISVDFVTLGSTSTEDPSTVGSQLTVTLHAELRDIVNAHLELPGDELCTLSNPATFTYEGLNTFVAPETCPTLDPGRPYFVVISRSAFNGGIATLKVTTSSDEDSGGAAGWSIPGRRAWFDPNGQGPPDGTKWRKVSSESFLIEVSGNAVVFDEQDLVNKHFNTLYAAGNHYPAGLWSDGATTMWVVDAVADKIFAYDMATKARKPAEDFDELASGNAKPRGIWSDGDTMWVSDEDNAKMFAYDMTTKARVGEKEFSGPDTFNGLGEEDLSAASSGIWSDGSGIMWIGYESGWAVDAYWMNGGGRHGRESFQPDNPIVVQIEGMWGDDQTIWVSDWYRKEATAFWRYNKARQPDRRVRFTESGNDLAHGIWSDGTTMWVADHRSSKIYAYPLPARQQRPVVVNMVSLEHVTDTTAVVKVDIQRLVRTYGKVEPAVSVKILGTRSSATMYVHPDAGYARFLLMGLSPETQYTVEVSYGITSRYRPNAGRKIFRTRYARLDGIETSGLTHTEATVTVSLEGADLDRRCCFKWHPLSNQDEGEPEHTFYLRHKPSDGTGWSDPVELNFSGSTGSTADARLTGLDPGTAYDVEVAETADFMPPTVSVPGYAGTLVVADDSGILGMDLTGFYTDPFGSMSPDPTFDVGGSERSITVLYVHTFGGPDFDQPTVYLEFDTAFRGSNIEFTLTIGTTVYHSTDATRAGAAYEWLGAPTWSEGDMVAVAIGFSQAVPFREGATLEVLGAFTTPTMPPTLAFEAEMTVELSTSSGTVTFRGYDGFGTGSVSPGNTFEVGGVEYTVHLVGYQQAGTPRFRLTVGPALPFDFTLTLGSASLPSSSATFQSNSRGRQYEWSGTNPNWASGSAVDVKLDIPLIDICGRSQAVADAIVAATASIDFCHMISQLDMDDITELDLRGRTGYGLKAGDFAGLPNLEILNLSGYSLGGHNWNQLPVGLFDGLDSLEVLDLSDTNLLNLNRGIFGGLSNLVELDLSDTLLDSTAVPVGVFDGLDSLQILRIANAGYEGRGINFVDEDIFRGLNTLRELDVGPIKPSTNVLAPLDSLETLNGQGYTR